MSDVTQILERVERGDAQAAEELLPLVYEELRRLATHKMAFEAPGNTLQPTARVHEAWLRRSARLPEQCVAEPNPFAFALLEGAESLGSNG